MAFPPTPFLLKGGHTSEDSRGPDILEKILNLDLSVFRLIFFIIAASSHFSRYLAEINNNSLFV